MHAPHVGSRDVILVSKYGFDFSAQFHEDGRIADEQAECPGHQASGCISACEKNTYKLVADTDRILQFIVEVVDECVPFGNTRFRDTGDFTRGTPRVDNVVVNVVFYRFTCFREPPGGV